jgi:hypothetical protein
MKALLLAVCQLCLFPLAFAASDTRSVPSSTIAVQGVQIVIPAPKGFVDPMLTGLDVSETAQALTASTNRFKLVFLSDADIKRGRAGKEMQWDRYFMVETNLKAESVNFDERDFAKFRAVFRQQQATLMERVKPQMQREVDMTVAKLAGTQGDDGVTIKVGETRSLGVFLDASDAIGMASLVNYAAHVNGRTVEQPVVVAWVTANVKHKVLYFYTNRTYRSAADIEDAERAAKLWMAEVAAANR